MSGVFTGDVSIHLRENQHIAQRFDIFHLSNNTNYTIHTFSTILWVIFRWTPGVFQSSLISFHSFARFQPGISPILCPDSWKTAGVFQANLYDFLLNTNHVIIFYEIKVVRFLPLTQQSPGAFSCAGASARDHGFYASSGSTHPQLRPTALCQPRSSLSRWGWSMLGV